MVGAETWIAVMWNDFKDLPWKQTEIILSFFEIAPKHCISNSSVDYDDYSIPFKEFLPKVVDIMVI